MKREIRHCIDPEDAVKLAQMPGLETTILKGLGGERMMMVLNATLPGHKVPVHSYPNEQIGVVYSGRAFWRIGDEEHLAEQGDSYCIAIDVPRGDRSIGDEPFVMLDIFHPVRADLIEKLLQVGKGENQQGGSG